MARSRCRITVQDAAGNKLVGASVYVYEAGTTTPIVATLYADPTTGATQANPLTTDGNAAILFYLTTPQNVDLRVTQSGYADITISQVPVGPNTLDTVTLTGTQTVTNKTMSNASNTFTGLFQLLGSMNLSVDAALLIVSSLPAYTGYQIQVQGRSAVSGNSENIGLLINGSTSSIYSSQMVAGNAASASSEELINEASCRVGNWPGGTTAQAGASGLTIIDIIQQQPGTWWPAIHARGGTILEKTTGTLVVREILGTFGSAGQVTSVSIVSQSGANLLAGSAMRVYSLP